MAPYALAEGAMLSAVFNSFARSWTKCRTSLGPEQKHQENEGAHYSS